MTFHRRNRFTQLRIATTESGPKYNCFGALPANGTTISGLTNSQGHV